MGKPNRLPKAVSQEMEPEGIIRRYSLQESGKHPVQADPGYLDYGRGLPRQLSYPTSPDGIVKMRHVSVPMGLPAHMQQEMIPVDKVRRFSLQEHKKHVSFSQNSVPQEPKPELNRHVSYPNGPGTMKMRRYSVCAVSRQQPLHTQRA